MRTILISKKCPKCGSGKFKRKLTNPANRFEGEEFRACRECGTPYYKPSSIFTAMFFGLAGAAFITVGFRFAGPVSDGPELFRWIMLGLGGLGVVIGIGLFMMRIMFLRLSERSIREGFNFGEPVLDPESGKWNAASDVLKKMVQTELE